MERTSRTHKKAWRRQPLTREADTRKLGQVTLSDIEQDEANSSPVLVIVSHEDAATRRAKEQDELTDALTVLVSLAIGVAVSRAAPHVKRWWEDNALPTMKATRNRIVRASRRGGRSGDTEQSAVSRSATTKVCTAVGATVGSPKVSMSVAEWQERFRLMLLVGAFQDEQWRLLSVARVGMRQRRRPAESNGRAVDSAGSEGNQARA
jgi:hypothetical protein